MLNMLIAIMGNTFAERSLLTVQIRMRDHLKFVIDKWHLIDGAFKKSNVNYVITAFAVSETGDDGEDQLNQDIYDLMNATRDNG